jgi:hypothetical protein
MKKAIVIIAVFLITATASQAFNPTGLLNVTDLNGRTLSMPVILEQPVQEELPFDAEAIFHEVIQEKISRVIDISKMSKPEPDADDVPQALRHIIRK